MNFIRTAQKLSRFFTDKDGASDVLEDLIRDKKHRQFFSMVRPLDGIKLAFLINGINKGLNIDNMLMEIEHKLVSFSIVEFEDIPFSDTCDDCGGSGNVYCDWCGGDGTINTNKYDEQDCPHCSGTGEDTCQTCDGEGEVTNENSTDYFIKTYVTFDSKIIEDISLLDIDVTEITYDNLKLNLMNPKLIYLGTDERGGGVYDIDKDYWGNSYVNDIDHENNPNKYVRSNSITINIEIHNLSNQFRS